LHLAPVPRTFVGVDAIVCYFGEEHGDFGLQGVGVLHFVDEDMGEAIAKVVACRDTVAEQIAREDQHVEELDLAGGPPCGGVVEGEALQKFEHGDQWRDLPGAGVGGGRRGEGGGGEQVVVFVEAVRDFAHVVQGHACGQGRAERLLRFGVVEGCIEPLCPAVFESDFGFDFIADSEAGGQAGSQRALAEEAAGEAMECLNRGLVQFFEGLFAKCPLRWGKVFVGGGDFEALGDAGAELGGGCFGECDGGDAAQLRAAGFDEGDDAIDEAACFAGAGAGLDDHVLVEVFEDCVACRLVGKGVHQLASSPAMAT